ncbi:unnamed protein product, partial [Porites evermanni]
THGLKLQLVPYQYRSDTVQFANKLKRKCLLYPEPVSKHNPSFYLPIDLNGSPLKAVNECLLDICWHSKVTQFSRTTLTNSTTQQTKHHFIHTTLQRERFWRSLIQNYTCKIKHFRKWVHYDGITEKQCAGSGLSQLISNKYDSILKSMQSTKKQINDLNNWCKAQDNKINHLNDSVYDAEAAIESI